MLLQIRALACLDIPMLPALCTLAMELIQRIHQCVVPMVYVMQLIIAHVILDTHSHQTVAELNVQEYSTTTQQCAHQEETVLAMTPVHVTLVMQEVIVTFSLALEFQVAILLYVVVMEHVTDLISANALQDTQDQTALRTLAIQ